jgi:hypothetical protein
LARNTPERRRKGVHWSPELDQLTTECLELMLEGRWETGRSHIALAKKHQSTESRIRQAAATASRFIRMCRGKEDEVRERVLMAIDRGEKAAFEAEKLVFDPEGGEWHRAKQPDLKSLIGFLQLQIEVHGLGRTSAKDPRPDDDNVRLPIEELGEMLDGLGFRMVRKDGESDSNTEPPDSAADE